MDDIKVSVEMLQAEIYIVHLTSAQACQGIAEEIIRTTYRRLGGIVLWTIICLINGE